MVDRVAVATMTLARSADEEDLLLRSLGRLAVSSLPIYVTDGGSSADFVARISQLPGFQIEVQAGKLVSQIKSSLRRAVLSGARFVLYTEPDKLQFFETGLTAFARRVVDEPDAAVIFASRDDASLETFPPGQREIEQSFNRITRVFLGDLPDVLYGPLIIAADIVTRYVDELADEFGWGWRPYLLSRCLQARQKVIFHAGHFPCPPEQRGEDDFRARRYRLQQLEQNVLALGRALVRGDQDL